MPGDHAVWTRIYNVAKSFADRGHEIAWAHYITGGNSSKSNPCEEAYKGHRFVYGNNASFPLAHLRTIRETKCDITYANTHAAAFYSIPTRIKNVPFVFDMHGDILAELALAKHSMTARRYARHLVVYSFMEFADCMTPHRIVCVSRKMLSVLMERGISKHRLILAPNGVDLNLFRPHDEDAIREARESLGIQNEFVLGYVGGFQPWQGLPNLLAAARLLKRRDVKLIILGGHEHREENNILFLPKVSRNKTPEIYSACDALILPRPNHRATQVASPTKFAEYSAMGKPIITTNVGDPGILTGMYNCGIIIESDKPESIAEGISDMASQTDIALRRMGGNSRLMAETEFDWQRIGSRLVEKITPLVGS